MFMESSMTFLSIQFGTTLTGETSDVETDILWSKVDLDMLVFFKGFVGELFPSFHTS
jgi:hypothetical protein